MAQLLKMYLCSMAYQDSDGDPVHYAETFMAFDEAHLFDLMTTYVAELVDVRDMWIFRNRDECTTPDEIADEVISSEELLKYGFDCISVLTETQLHKLPPGHMGHATSGQPWAHVNYTYSGEHWDAEVKRKLVAIVERRIAEEDAASKALVQEDE